MRVSVTVPATSANLGPGFDVFGLALELCNEVTIDTDEPPGVTWEGEGADELPTDGTDMVSAAIASVATSMEISLPPFSLHGVNRIPLQRGLGSSSAAAVAGVVLASRVFDLGIDGHSVEPADRDSYSVFANAAAIEGHPDNAAPASFGGFTVALSDGYVRRFDPHPALRPVVVVPTARVATDEARAALSDTVARADAVFNAGHAALMVEALTRDPALLRVALHDRLHEDTRLAFVPEVADVYAELRRSNVPVCVSGAGPTLLAFVMDDSTDITHELLGVSSDWRIWPLAARAEGFRVGHG